MQASCPVYTLHTVTNTDYLLSINHVITVLGMWSLMQFLILSILALENLLFQCCNHMIACCVQCACKLILSRCVTESITQDVLLSHN